MKNPLKILCVIVDRTMEEKLLRALGKHVNFLHVAYGHGTANSEVLAVLGIGEVGKAVLIGAVTEDNVEAVMKLLVDKFRFGSAGKGVAFTVPVTSVGGTVSLSVLCGKHLK